MHHALLQVGQEELAVEGVNGGDVGEEVPHHLQGEGALGRLFRQTGAEHLRRNQEELSE